MNILFIGDIFGGPGRDATKKLLPKIKKEMKISFVIANGENLTHGKGMSPEHVKEMMSAGVDFFTSGNHVWKNKDGVARLDDPKFPVIRPANYPPGVPGRGYKVVSDGLMKKILVVSLLGRVFMQDDTDCPFRTMDKILEETKHENLSAIIVDFHAEATSEKVAFGHYMDGRVSAVLGTHTHIPTADGRILDGGTAYITDVGMVGPRDSVIGLEKDTIIKQFLTQLPAKHNVAESECTFCAVKVEIDPKTKQAKSIEHIIDVV